MEDKTKIEALKGVLSLNLPEEYIPQTPTPRQAAFLLVPHREAFFGGAAGPGKSSALLMSALQYVDISGYNAILFRRTYKDLAQPGALMDRAHEWLGKSDAKWDKQEKRWTFPSGATLTFAYMDTEVDKYNYQGAEFQFVGFDELTQFTFSMYSYMFSRMRRTKDNLHVPLRMRAAGNPGGVGHEWVKERFIDLDDPDDMKKRIFVPASLADNPHVDSVEYMESLDNLDPVTRAQLKNGDWDVEAEGNMFRREWFDGRILQEAPRNVTILRKVRYWDLASSDDTKTKADYTASCLMGLGDDGNVYVLEISRDKLSAANVEKLVQSKAERDGRVGTTIYMEQEPGSSGVGTIDHYRRYVLLGYNFRGDRPTGDKVERARNVSAACEHGLVYLVAGDKTKEFILEAQAFPMGAHDDMVDALAGAFLQVSKMGRVGKAKDPSMKKRRTRSLWS
jgi:predicted phage terminase large subunit-like protein